MANKNSHPARVAYLFGAGATHAELANLCAKQMADASFQARNSLLLSSVSKRVCTEAIRKKQFPKRIAKLIYKKGLSNVELFISLLEENRVDSTPEIVRRLKAGLQHDISTRLKNREDFFYLHKALFEFHKRTRSEKLIGLISLNYDHLLDDAYLRILRKQPNYCFSISNRRRNAIPLLKLHGGFALIYRDKKLPIMAPGVNKNYLELPYNFIWGRALELLLECDVLRVIGCSLSQNDLGIVDLLFKAHIKRSEPFTMEIIDFDPKNNTVKEHFGFFPNIQCALDIEGRLISDVTIQDHTTGANPFKIWLRAKIKKAMKQSQIRKTRYVKQVLE